MNKYFLIPVLITLVYAIAFAVAGMRPIIIYSLMPILFLGHAFGFLLATHHFKMKNKNKD